MDPAMLSSSAEAIGRWLTDQKDSPPEWVGKQAQAASPVLSTPAPRPSAAPAPAATAAAPAAPAPALTTEQKKMVVSVLSTRVDGAKANADEAMDDFQAGRTDFPEPYLFVNSLRGAISLLVEQGKKHAADADWTAGEEAMGKADDMLARAATEWNLGQQGKEATESLKAALGLYVAAAESVRAVLKKAGLL